MPRILEFLGYIQFVSKATSFDEHIKANKVREGLSLRRMAKILAVDPGTVARWGNEGNLPDYLLLKKLKKLGAIMAS